MDTSLGGSQEVARVDIQVELPNEPSFPVLMMIIAVMKDLMDMVLNLTFLLSWLTLPLGALFSITVWIWIQTHPAYMRRSGITSRFMVWGLLGVVPFLNFFPESAWLVYVIHRREVRAVRKLRESAVQIS